MRKIALIFAVLVMAVSLSGCIFSMPEKFTEANAQIAASNDTRLAIFGSCGDNAACQVAVSMAFAGNMGQQQFFRPETARDYLQAFMPYATLGVDVFRLWGGFSGGGSGGYVVTGDNNSFSGIGNDLVADNESSLSATFSSSTSLTSSEGNRDFNLGSDAGTIDDTGIIDPVTVDDDISTEPVTVTEN